MARSPALGFANRIRELSGVGATRLTERSGVSRATQHRIDTGQSDATLRTLRELAVAAGLDIDIALVPLSDPNAATGARSILDPTITAAELTAGAIEWAERLRRLAAPELDPIRIVTEAGRATAPLHRAEAVLLHGAWDDMKLVSAATAAGGRWVLSGAPALQRIADTPLDRTGPAIMYADDPAAVARHLTHLRPTRPATATVAVLPLPEATLVDSWADGPVRLVAPVQAIIDNIGLGGTAADTALDIARSW